ncbi:RNA polymerase sigma factor for flagellar operon [hydrothermal vent metagenome]|uniref:RNA polymerase sigma factor for flagellar operon n=1 Tax=hydrothermal vent metagenome TaxID=652676 RepID=A0A3B1BGI4_9ZZZZ
MIKKLYSEPPKGGVKLGTPEADDLIVEYSPLIKFIAHRLAMRLPPNIEVDDLISAGVIGLIDAIEKFNPDKETQFKTYAEIRVRGAMLDELRSLDWVPRSVRQKASTVSSAYAKLEQQLGRPAEDDEVSEAMGLSIAEFHTFLQQSSGQPILSIEDLGGTSKDGEKRDLMEILAGTKETDPETLARLSEIRSIIARAIDELPEKDRLLISLYYYEELTMKEIGEVLDITESRVSQIHTKCVFRLRSKLRKFIHDEDELDASVE